jgi:FHS family L-fucose permease-like MFS transporter
VQGAYLGLCGALVLLALGTAALPMPLLDLPRQGDRAEGGSLLAHRHLVLGAVGIFTYVGAEVAIGSFLVSFLSQPSVGGLSLPAAARLVALYWGGAMVGRFLGAAVMRRVAPARVLAAHAAAAMVLVLTAMLARGGLAVAAILAVGLCNSIMFPTIFTLAIQGLGQQMGRASGFLCVAIVGGAVVPVLQGLAADAVGIRPAFSLAVLCYAYIVFYGVKGHVPVPGGDQP